MDMAPYFVTALVNLFGPVDSVVGLATRSRATRRVARADGTVEEIDVAVSTHASALLRFSGDIVGTFISSFDIWDHHLPAIEVYGSDGTLSLPHPNWFDGEVALKPIDEPWRILSPVTRRVELAPREKILGLGLLDLVESLDGAPHRSSSALGLHTLEVLEAVQRSSDTQRWVDITNRCSRPAPVL
jgi:predicted dehydrogenase